MAMASFTRRQVDEVERRVCDRRGTLGYDFAIFIHLNVFGRLD
jgi:hypothetical protein